MKIKNIFISAIGYNCAEHLEKVLMPFLSFKKTLDYKVTISTAHGVFPETHALGYGINSFDSSEVLLKHYNEVGMTTGDENSEYIKTDKFFKAEEPIFEKDLRNKTFEGYDLSKYEIVWLLDLQDEIYTVENINCIISFVEKNKYVDWFKVSFKNYVGEKTWIDGFTPPRIWRTNLHQGIKGFYYDNDIQYNDGARANNLPSITIPRSVAFVTHLSWVGSPEYLNRKIQFQKSHYSHCSYKWNEEEGQLEFDRSYFLKIGESLPILNYDK